MKGIVLALVLSVAFSALFSQEYIEKEKQVEVLETTEVSERKSSVGLSGGIVNYFGEQTSETGLDYGFLFRNHINSKFDITFNFHLGKMAYKDSADLSQETSYYGLNSVFKLNIIETFGKKDEPQFISPYVGAGLGLLISKAPHYTVSQYIDFYVPIAVGVDVNVSDNFIVGVNATGRVLFSDKWDNVISKSGNDFLFNPSISLKYVIAQRKVKKQEYVTRTIKYKEEVAAKGNFGKYEKKKIEEYVEVSVKEIRDSNEVAGTVNELKEKETEVSNNSSETNTEVSANVTETNTSEANNTNVKEVVATVVEIETNEEEKVEVKEVSASDQDYLFYTVQLGSYPTKAYEMRGITQDFEFYNKVLNKYNYCKGIFGSSKEASKALAEIKAKGKKGYVIAIYKDERLKVYTAQKMVNSGKTRVDVEAAKEVYLK